MVAGQRIFFFPRVWAESRENKKTLQCNPHTSLVLTLSVPAGWAVTKMNERMSPVNLADYTISYLEAPSLLDWLSIVAGRFNYGIFLLESHWGADFTETKGICHSVDASVHSRNSWLCRSKKKNMSPVIFGLESWHICNHFQSLGCFPGNTQAPKGPGLWYMKRAPQGNWLCLKSPTCPTPPLPTHTHAYTLKAGLLKSTAARFSRLFDQQVCPYFHKLTPLDLRSPCAHILPQNEEFHGLFCECPSSE